MSIVAVTGLDSESVSPHCTGPIDGIRGSMSSVVFESAIERAGTSRLAREIPSWGKTQSQELCFNSYFHRISHSRNQPTFIVHISNSAVPIDAEKECKPLNLQERGEKQLNQNRLPLADYRIRQSKKGLFSGLTLEMEKSRVSPPLTTGGISYLRDCS